MYRLFGGGGTKVQAVGRGWVRILRLTTANTILKTRFSTVSRNALRCTRGGATTPHLQRQLVALGPRSQG
jgi:hypothetical protein